MIQSKDAGQDVSGCCAPADVDSAALLPAARRRQRRSGSPGSPRRSATRSGSGMLDVMAQGRACCGLPEPSQRGVPGAGDPEGICVCDFQEHFGLGQSKVSYHLRVLREAGLVREEARGKWTFYAIDGEAAAEALDAFRDLLRV